MRDYTLQTDSRTPERDHEITGVETAVLRGNFDWNLVRIHTDAGVVGLGESYRGGAVVDIIDYLAEFLLGENPLDVERLARKLVQESSGHGGTTGKVVTAISGLEIALWDLAGKLLDVPVYQLLGGKFRDAVRVYADLHAGEAYAVDHGATAYSGADAYTPEAYAETARQAVDLGFSAIKFDLDMPGDTAPDRVNGRLQPEDIDAKVGIVAAVREAIPPDVEVAFDCHWDYELDSAKRLARALEEYDLMWLEDVIPPENMAAQTELTRSTTTPIATGENRFRVHEFRDLLADFGVDILTPDPTTLGGIAESKAIANRAEEQYLTVSPHNVCSPVGTTAVAHLGAAIPNLGVVEYHALEVDWWEDLLDRDEPLIQDGVIEVPEGPGLGISLDDGVAEDHAVRATEGFFA